jgi:acyl-coenzyme A thioesterase PaaI-like protein
MATRLASKKALQALLNRSKFIRHYGFRVVRASEEACVIELPHRAMLERPGGIINGPALMAAADCAMWLAIKTRHVYCTARILKLGRRSIYGTAECHGKTGRLFSHHTVTYVRTEA